MALSAFSDVKKVSFGDDDKWSVSSDEHGNLTYTNASESDDITIEYNTNPPPAETIECPVGSTVIVTNTGAVSVRTP